jgi:hypothetical protein
VGDFRCRHGGDLLPAAYSAAGVPADAASPQAPSAAAAAGGPGWGDSSGTAARSGRRTGPCRPVTLTQRTVVWAAARSHPVVAGGEGCPEVLAGCGKWRRSAPVRRCAPGVPSTWATRSLTSSSACRPRGGEDEFGPLVGAVWPAFQVAELLQVADQLARVPGGQTVRVTLQSCGVPELGYRCWPGLLYGSLVR